jgi:hypothetical protein
MTKGPITQRIQEKIAGIMADDPYEIIDAPQGRLHGEELIGNRWWSWSVQVAIERGPIADCQFCGGSGQSLIGDALCGRCKGKGTMPEREA